MLFSQARMTSFIIPWPPSRDVTPKTVQTQKFSDNCKLNLGETLLLWKCFKQKRNQVLINSLPRVRYTAQSQWNNCCCKFIYFPAQVKYHISKTFHTTLFTQINCIVYIVNLQHNNGMFRNAVTWTLFLLACLQRHCCHYILKIHTLLWGALHYK